ncbi:MAG: hypothetical protein ACKVOE_01870 [Rickettsiales bacterium]
MAAHRRMLFLSLVSVVLITATAAMAAQISAQTRSSYQRISFTFNAEPQMQISGGGTALVLSFNQPLEQPPSAISNKLRGYAKSVTLSNDGKQLSIALTKPFRTRQFRSGTTVGLDLIGAPDEAALAQTQTAVPEAPSAATPNEKPLPPKTEKRLPKNEPRATAAKPPATKSKPPEKPKAEPAPVDAILSTKAATPEKPEEVLTTKAAPAPKAEPKPESKPEPVLAAEPKPEPAPTAEPATPAPVAKATPPVEAKTSPEAAPEKKDIPFIVTGKTTGNGTVIDFPWQGRTAAALFERARDIWLVFDHPADANVALLRTILPKGVVDVTQFALPGATVLRLTTDGSLHARATQSKGEFNWKITLGTSAQPPTLDTPVTGDSTNGEAKLVIAAFDAADPIRFYDPRIGDLLLAIPTFESGRGISNLKSYPELSVLASGQGITLTSNRDDLTTSRNRNGITVSAPGGLAISGNLSTLTPTAVPVPGTSALSDVMIPYDQWYVAPELFVDTRAARLRAVANASAATKPDALLQMVSLYLGQGLGAEAAGYLALLRERYPDYYTARKLALLDGAASFMQGHLDAAQKAISAPELSDVTEAQLWREAVGLSAPEASEIQKLQNTVTQGGAPAAPPAPAPAPAADDDQDAGDKPSATPSAASARPPFRFLKWNKPYIHFYPPRIRQRLAITAADAYLENGQDDKALAAYETLNRDGILTPIKHYAEITIAEIAASRNQTKQALEAFDTLSDQSDDPYISTRARFDGAMLSHKLGLLSDDDTAEILERLLLGWRGDALERKILDSLVMLYRDAKRYDAMLRSWRKIIEDFPGDPQILKISGDMSQLFQELFLGDALDEQPPLKALALFYEFRDLTPVGDTGDQIIQKLADRLAAVDLLDRATQLLENQVKFRLSGEERSRVGARLALLYLLNQQPQEALNVLQITNFGTNAGELQTNRQQLTAEALSKLGKNTEALSLIFNDSTHKGTLLRLDLLWGLQDWPNVINRAEDILAARANLTATLTTEETDVLLKLALAYAFEGDSNQLKFLREFYGPLVPDSAYREIFNFITSDTAPLDAADLALLTKQISNTESFMTDFKAKIAAGKLSDTVK